MLYSIHLPQHILNKYQNLRNSVLSTQDFSFDKFANIFSVGQIQEKPINYSEIYNIMIRSLIHIHTNTMMIIENSRENSFYSSPNKNMYPLKKPFPNHQFYADINQDTKKITYEINDFEKKITENLEIIKETLNNSNISIKALDQEIRKSQYSYQRNESFESLYRENEIITRKNNHLKEEIIKLKEI